MFSKGILRNLSEEEMSKEEELKELLEKVKDLPESPGSLEPASFHIKKGHTVISNSAAGESFLVCKECCKEVYDDRKDPIT
jgi:hypothetical protein